MRQRTIPIVGTAIGTLLCAGALTAAAQQPYNSSEIVQKGHSNKTILAQDGSGNTSSILSEGSDNTIFGNQENSRSGGQYNFFESRSIGNGNRVLLEQINSAGAPSGNIAIVNQGGDRNSATISQDIASLVLGEGGNYASITQSGDEHEATVDQLGDDNFASLDQTGRANKGELIQNGSGLSAELIQNGSGLEYTITQTGCAIAGGCGTIIVTQSGS